MSLILDARKERARSPKRLKFGLQPRSEGVIFIHLFSSIVGAFLEQAADAHP
jgi:hypothetical protein